ncbi:hypothetical protein OPT61_g10738 [Boeremia exigua]|uniref:Uncharacterized protein n=1 Tax=Boeremia exigua TaxID=749465 RepID=A0ACC2HNV3_9PLEO|nr:hypothetical protein OPT61_g10738 [Boeremia exigua]
MTNPAVDELLNSTILSRHEPLGTDQYISAFSPSKKSFMATPNDYTAAQPPTEVLDRLLGSDIIKVTWASFGPEDDSWFFAFDMSDRTSTFQMGAGVPKALRSSAAKTRSSAGPARPGFAPAFLRRWRTSCSA